MPRLSTSSVIAIEKTPSLKATIRENSTSFSSRRSRSAPWPSRIIDPGRDGTADRSLLEWATRRRSSVGRALHS